MIAQDLLAALVGPELWVLRACGACNCCACLLAALASMPLEAAGTHLIASLRSALLRCARSLAAIGFVVPHLRCSYRGEKASESLKNRFDGFFRA